MRNAIAVALVLTLGCAIAVGNSTSAVSAGGDAVAAGGAGSTASKRPAAPELTARRSGRVVRVTWRASRSRSDYNFMLFSGHDARKRAIITRDVEPGTKTSGSLTLPIAQGFEIRFVGVSRFLDGSRSRVRIVPVR